MKNISEEGEDKSGPLKSNSSPLSDRLLATTDKVKEKMSQFEVDYTIDITKPFGQDMLVATPRETIFAGSNDNWWS